MKKSIALLVSALVPFAMAAADPLESGFKNPPDSAKPQTWWHWMNGNITKVGIQKDLEAMKAIGLGGATIVNVDSGIPRGPVEFMSPEWRDDFKFAAQQADQLGLELCVENCAGWSSSGGPWNTPTNAMQRVTISELHLTGPTNFNAALPQPATQLDFYRDIAVLAFPETPGENVRMEDSPPSVSLSTGEDSGNKLTDGDRRTQVLLPAPNPSQPQFVQLAFAQPFSTRSVKITGGRNMPGCAGRILVSDDGQSFRPAHAFEVPRHINTPVVVSLGDEPVTARFWRVQFDNDDTRSKGEAIPVAEISLSPRLLTGSIEAKDGESGAFVLANPEADQNNLGAIPQHDIVNLTSKCDANGRLNWRVPHGRWVILRIGYTPTGVNNHPAAWGGLGLECDKFSKSALDQHWNGFMQKVLDDLGPLAGKSLNCSLIDSYEVRGQNWTRDFAAEFKKRRGYDLTKYLPAFTGRVVENSAATERFLWDVRRTIADLFAENYYAHFNELCHQHGLKSAIEPYTGPFESLQCGGPADIVMGEFWSGSQGHPSIKLAASVAHIYGKTIVGAESFTAAPQAGRWQNDPYSEKALGDLMYCQGLNRYIFHRYAMQPWTNRWPGMTMGQWGFHFERTITWWDQGKAWIDYISHCEFMLQQGRPVQDAAYFDGESSPVEMRQGNPPLPSGYDYDAVDADVLMHGATVKDGRLTLASGANYSVLILPPEDINMTPAMLECLRKLVRAGLTVVGPRPEHSPSLADYPHCDARVRALAHELWGNIDGTNVLEHACGQGRVIWGKSLADIFAGQNLAPDFAFTNADGDANLAYAHRVAGNTDIYFVSSQHHNFSSADCTFRVTGRIPELWHPETGVIEPAPVWSNHDGRTTVRLDFDPAGSVFVVFRQPIANEDHIVAVSGNVPAGSSGMPKLEIQHAVYAATDGAGEKDVTGKVSALVRAGEPVWANNDLVGDPVPDHVKELRVDYAIDGQSRHVTAHENEQLPLPEAWPSNPPQWEISTAANNSPAIVAWNNGEIEARTANGKTLHAETIDIPAPQELSGDWTLNFPPNWGAPPSVTLDKLISWTDHTNDGVRYFSGTATYEKDIDISADRLTPGRELWLDLGKVKNFAQVSLNGHEFGVLWKPPFRVNITSAAQAGTNHLLVKVTNLWPNRLIGDEQLPPDVEWDGAQLKAWPQWLLDGKPSPTGRLTFTTWHHYNKNSPLLESGLLGPVTLKTAETVKAQ